VFRVLDSLPGFKTHIHINTPLLVPMLWFIVFALSLKLILMHNKRGMRFVCVIISLQVLLGFFFHGEIQKHRKPSYRELFSVDLFKQIDDHIGRPKSEYRIASIGIFPGISLYNGFYTLDGYHTNYPLEHKKKFRKIIAGELRKSTQAREHFDDWGGRCYVFVSELQFGNWTNTKNKNVVIQNLDLNTNVFVEMGGEYIISAVEIKNYKANQLDFEKVFEDVNSPWRLYLYRAKGIPSQSKMPEI
jgi:hypothetical protein